MVVLDDHIRNHVINYSQSSPGGLQGQIMSSVLTLIVGELLKLVLIERLFSLTRDKLMKIPAFAWVYTKFQQAKVCLQATEAWQAIRTLSRAASNYVAQMKRSGTARLRESRANRPEHKLSKPIGHASKRPTTYSSAQDGVE
jgi:hypothetical protein